MKKGFTLIELLIVIAILAVLATAVITVLNPAQLLKQARDSTRISDLAALNSALALYLADVSSPDLGACTDATVKCTAGTTSTNSGFSGTRSTCDTISTSSAVSGAGWVDVNFSSTSAGSPLPKEPIDPVTPNTASYFYSYTCDDPAALTYEIDARMESTKYGASGGSDVVTTDGGNSSTTYEVGNLLTF